MSRDINFEWEGTKCKNGNVAIEHMSDLSSDTTSVGQYRCQYDGYVTYAQRASGVTITQLLATTEYYFRAAAVHDTQPDIDDWQYNMRYNNVA